MISLPNQHEPYDQSLFTGSFYFRVDDANALWLQLKDKATVVYPIEESTTACESSPSATSTATSFNSDGNSPVPRRSRKIYFASVSLFHYSSRVAR